LTLLFGRRCHISGKKLVGKSDWSETPSTADEMILVTKGFCGYRGSFATKLLR
jgi:hypothetical protein